MKNTKIIVLSSSIWVKDIERAKATSHVYAYIEKPISVEKLEELMIRINAEPGVEV